MLRRGSKAFTIIELMIVVSIISILACIGVPILLRARMAANEVAAMSGVKTILTAQSQFKRTDWDLDGIFNYADTYDELYAITAPAKVTGCITKELCRARSVGSVVDPTPIADKGYLYLEAQGYWTAAGFIPRSTVVGIKVLVGRYGALAFPEQYMLSGTLMFAGDDTGNIWQKEARGDLYYETDAPARPLWDPNGMAANGWVGQ